MFYRFSLLLSCLFLISCSSITPEQRTYLDEVKKFPLSFTISKSKNDVLWGRAQSFIAQYSSMKIQIATDFVIQTYNPPGSEVKYGYSVTKTPENDNFRIIVKCFCGNPLVINSVRKNAHIFSYYLKTGENPYPKLISR